MSDTKPSLGLIKRLLSWPSGAVNSVLAQCPSDQNYYCALGVLVWLTSLLAGCGMALMLSQTGSVGWQALAGGGSWFLCILNLDRFLLIATTEGKGWKRLVPFARILLSLCLAIIIGEHVVQYLFRNEINNQLAQERLATRRFNYDKAKEAHPEFGLLISDKEKKQAEIDAKQAEVLKLRDEYIKEAEGSAGSGIRGKGPLYEQKQRDYLTALGEKQKLDKELEELDRRLNEKNGEIKNAAKDADEAKANERGFLAYHRALFAIIRQDATLLLLYIVISSAMIMFEVTPLVSKLSGKERLYDRVLEDEEERRREGVEENREEERQEAEKAAALRAQINGKLEELKLHKVEQVANAVKNNEFAGLAAEDAELARGFKARVDAEITARLGRRNPGGAQEPPRPAVDVGAAGNGDTADVEDASSVNVVLADEDAPSSFTIVFRCPPGEVLGRDLIYSLAGLERQRPPGDSPRVALHECRVANANDKEINPDAPLFPQLGGEPSVFLSSSEVTVSEADN